MLSFKEFFNLVETWLKHSDGTYSAEISDISHHPADIHCPNCRAVLSTSMNPLGKAKLVKTEREKPPETDVTAWKYECTSCHAKLTVFND